MTKPRQILIGGLLLLLAAFGFRFVMAASEGDETSPIRLKLVYEKQRSLAGEDKQRYDYLESSKEAGDQLSPDSVEVDPSKVYVHLDGDHARLEWSTSMASTLKLKNSAIQAELEKAGVDFFKHQNHLSRTRNETMIWNGGNEMVLHTIVNSNQDVDVATSARTERTQKKQMISKVSLSKCKSLDSYRFRFPVLESPCQIQDWIESGRWVKSEQKRDIEVSLRRTASDFETVSLSCDVYVPATDLPHLNSSKCIAYIDDIPVVLEDSITGGDGERLTDSNSSISYRILELDMRPGSNLEPFSFATAAVCKMNDYQNERWIRC